MQKRPTIVFYLRLCEFTRTQKYSNLTVSTGDYQVTSTPKIVNLLSAAGAVFFRNFIFSFNNQRGAVELTTNARWSDNLKRTPVASRTTLFSDQRVPFCHLNPVSVRVFCFPFSRTLSSQVVTCGITL